MSNMSYCRFRNTVKDLQDCVDFLCESGDPLADLSDEEKRAAKRLFKLCKMIADDFCEEQS